jgi:nucleotide-binding universal stress UspA family protein
VSKPVRRILWAVDAFTEDKALQMRLIHQLKAWNKEKKAVIEPVTILNPDQMGPSLDLFLKERSNIEKSAIKSINRMTDKVKVPGLLPPKLLLSRDLSLQHAVNTLLTYAKLSGADLIAVSTQSRKGVSHFLFGSFAETLILKSEIPIFAINPKTHNKTREKSILFATDLSSSSRPAFEQVVTLAKEREMSIVLYNRVEYLTEFTRGNFELPDYADYRSRDIAAREEKMAAFAEYAKKQGVKVEWEMDQKSQDYVYDSIVRVAKKRNVSLIAMASLTETVASAILGSTTRQVLRSASSPIWVIHLRPTESIFKQRSPYDHGKSHKRY